MKTAKSQGRGKAHPDPHDGLLSTRTAVILSLSAVLALLVGFAAALMLTPPGSSGWAAGVVGTAAGAPALFKFMSLLDAVIDRGAQEDN